MPNETQPKQRIPYKEMIIAGAVASGISLIVADFYRGFRRKIRPEPPPPPMPVYIQQLPPPEAPAAAAATPNPAMWRPPAPMTDQDRPVQSFAPWLQEAVQGHPAPVQPAAAGQAPNPTHEAPPMSGDELHAWQKRLEKWENNLRDHERQMRLTLR